MFLQAKLLAKKLEEAVYNSRIKYLLAMEALAGLENATRATTLEEDMLLIQLENAATQAEDSALEAYFWTQICSAFLEAAVGAVVGSELHSSAVIIQAMCKKLAENDPDIDEE